MTGTTRLSLIGTPGRPYGSWEAKSSPYISLGVSQLARMLEQEIVPAVAQNIEVTIIEDFQ